MSRRDQTMVKPVHGRYVSPTTLPCLTSRLSRPWTAKLRRPAWVEGQIRLSSQAVGHPDTPPTGSTPPVSHVRWSGVLAIISDLVGLLLALWILFLMWSYAS